MNRHSVELLREIRRYVAAANPEDQRERAALAAELSENRRVFDLRMRRRMERLIREKIEERYTAGA